MNLFRLWLILCLSLTLIACGGGTAVKPESKPANKPATAKPSGGYYLDDGPGSNTPPGMDKIPDAVPRFEVPLARANRPYTALGTRYTPMTEYKPYKESGIASWYGKRYHGQKTSSGEVYDMYGMTGAHTILPLPSYARVSNPANGKSVVIRINDRGPFHSDRLIDLSYAAAYKLGLIEKGSGLVEVEAIDTSIGSMLKLPETPAPRPETIITPTAPVKPEPVPAASTAPITPAVAEPAVAPALAIIENSAPAVAGSYIQLGVFKQKDNADRLTEKLRQQQLTENTPVENWYNNGTYRVRVGPYTSRQTAERIASKIKQSLNINAVVIDQK